MDLIKYLSDTSAGYSPLFPTGINLKVQTSEPSLRSTWAQHHWVHPGASRTAEPRSAAAVRGLRLSITGWCKDANDGWSPGQLHSRAALQLRQMKSPTLCVPSLAPSAPARNGSLKTKTNKWDIWIWTLEFNHSVAAARNGLWDLLLSC